VKYIDIFSGKSNEFMADFVRLFAEDVIAAGNRRNANLTETQMESLLSVCFDKINLVALKCRRKSIAFHCIRVEMEVLPTDCVKFMFKAINAEGETVLEVKSDDELYFLATDADIREFQKRAAIEISFVPDRKPNSN
jgi:hypothetical protein